MKHSDEFYRKLSEHLEKNKSAFSLEDRIIAFNKYVIEELNRKCAYCGKQIIRKGHIIDDSMGLSGDVYHVCNRECADRFLEEM